MTCLCRYISDINKWICVAIIIFQISTSGYVSLSLYFRYQQVDICRYRYISDINKWICVAIVIFQISTSGYLSLSLYFRYQQVDMCRYRFISDINKWICVVIVIFQISTSGYVSLSWSLPFYSTINDIQQFGNPIIAPLFSTADGRSSRVQYRLHTDTATLQQATSMVSGHADAAGFRATSVLKVTWTAMRAYPAGQESIQSGLSDLGVSVTLQSKNMVLFCGICLFFWNGACPLLNIPPLSLSLFFNSWHTIAKNDIGQNCPFGHRHQIG